MAARRAHGGDPVTPQLTCALPPGYLLPEVLAFHARDAEQVSEQVSATGVRKAIMLAGTPTLLDVRFGAGVAQCGIVTAPRRASISQAVHHAASHALLSMLGLRVDPAPFIDQVRDDALFGPLVTQLPPLRIVQSCTLFEALCWAIIGQQINLQFAIALRRTLTRLAGTPHPSGLTCLPDAPAVAALDVGQLTSQKFSRAKAETLLRVARRVHDGSLVLEHGCDVEQLAQQLLAIKGIGPWTVNYLLLRGFGYPDCSLHGDVAVRAALQKLTHAEARPTISEAERMLARYRPQRTMAAAYLWAGLRLPQDAPPA